MYFNKTTSCATYNDHDINPPIMIGSTEIKRVSKIKFLGVLIDENYHGKPMSSHLQKS